MPRAAFVAVLSCAFLSSVEPSYADCRGLPPASERAGYWQYRVARQALLVWPTEGRCTRTRERHQAHALRRKA
jgi:hypothetical protein